MVEGTGPAEPEIGEVEQLGSRPDPEGEIVIVLVNRRIIGEGNCLVT